jgi:hypothetical protein
LGFIKTEAKMAMPRRTRRQVVGKYEAHAHRDQERRLQLLAEVLHRAWEQRQQKGAAMKP